MGKYPLKNKTPPQYPKFHKIFVSLQNFQLSVSFNKQVLLNLFQLPSRTAKNEKILSPKENKNSQLSILNSYRGTNLYNQPNRRDCKSSSRSHARPTTICFLRTNGCRQNHSHQSHLPTTRRNRRG